MVKRLLFISLFLFVPTFVSADSSVLGQDLDEKNIPFKLDIMQQSFEEAFGEQIDVSNNIPISVIDSNRLQDRFYNYVYDYLDVPFSVRELFNACRNSVGKMRANECVKFSSNYLKYISEYLNNKNISAVNNADSVNGISE